jgi:hypothetical protein
MKCTYVNMLLTKLHAFLCVHRRLLDHGQVCRLYSDELFLAVWNQSIGCINGRVADLPDVHNESNQEPGQGTATSLFIPAQCTQSNELFCLHNEDECSAVGG